MALQDLMELSLSKGGKKMGLSEERIREQLPVIREYIAYWREYPDMFVEFLCGENNPENFHLFFYQRLFLRAVMRHRYAYATFPRAYSKSFLSVLILMLRCVLYPGAHLFVTTGGKEQAAGIAREKAEELCKLIPGLKNEIDWTRGASKASKNMVEYLFKNGSKLDIMAAQQSSRGKRATGGLVEECILVDQTLLNEVIIPTMNVDRRLADGSRHEEEVINKLSYTMQFYGYDEWQKELDYLMLSGVNVILDTTASEALWVAFLQQYGYTAQEAIDFVCGYAFKAWWLMGNLENYGGSVGDQWMYDTLEMARVNQRYMTVMGCMPCLNIFAGTLPTNFATKADAALTAMGYANVRDYMTSTGGWCGFTRPYAMNTTFPGFEKMSQDFYETQNNLYGQITDYYAGDFLHEIEGSFKLDPAFDKANMSRTVLDYLLDENSEACWIMQSWWENPLPEVVAGFGDDREDHVLMLDLAAVNDPRWQKTDRFGGKEFGGSGWVYCMLDNYGGRTGMHGAFNTIVTGLLKAYKEAKHFKGIGITPEGTEENPASYDFYWEMVWVSLSDVPAGQSHANFAKDYVAKWIENYAKRRYNTDSQNVIDAWKILSTSVYGNKTVDNTSTNGIITSYPHFFEGDGKTIAFDGGYYHVPYNEEDLERATNLMLKEFDKLKNEETYIYDVCDMLCQLLTNSSTVYFDKMGQAILDNDRSAFTGYKNKYLRCIELIDEITAFVDDTMLGNWVGRIDDWVNDERTGDYADYDIDTMKYNTLTLITTWASHASLVGYANREYSGLMNDYYYKIWDEYLNRIDGKAVGALADVQSNNAEYFQYAWDIIVSKGEGYDREITPANGGNGKRSLVQIYSEIVRKLLKNSPVIENKLTIVSEDENIKAVGRQLRGLSYGLLASDLLKIVKSSNGGKITVLDENGNLLGENVYVHEGCQIVLHDEDGMRMDMLNINGMKGGKRVEFKADTISVAVGKQTTLEVNFIGATLNEKAELVFTSSDPTIATVDENGVIKGIAEGTVTITVTANGEFTDTIEVTVTPKDMMPMIIGISIGAGALVLIAGVAIVWIVLKKKKAKKD